MVRYAIITGASSGFGKAISSVLAEEGFKLILLARREDKLTLVKNDLQAKGFDAITYTLDIRNVKDVESWAQSLPNEIKENIEVLINNAGLAVGRSSVEDGLVDDWDRMIDTNLKGLLYVSKAIIPYLRARKKGSLINITSIAGKEAYLGGNVYCASKAAVDHLTKTMRLELAQDQIRVCSIAPGAAETEFSMVRFKGDKEKADEVYKGFDALQAIDIAEAVRFVITRPSHVSIHDMVIMPTAQATASLIYKNQ